MNPYKCPNGMCGAYDCANCYPLSWHLEYEDFARTQTESTAEPQDELVDLEQSTKTLPSACMGKLTNPQARQ